MHVRPVALAVAALICAAGCLPSFDAVTCETCFDAAPRDDAAAPDAGAPDGGGDAGTLIRARALAAGMAEQHSCAVMEDETLRCWGDNASGQLGLVVDRAVRPSTVPGLPPIDEAVTGFLHTCARSRGRVYCFGDNLHGQLGLDSGARFVPTPTRVGDIEDAVQLAAGMFHTCVLRAGGRVDCWGSDLPGQPDRISPVQIPGFPSSTSEIAAGHDMTAGLAGGEVWILGDGSCWRLGLGGGQNALVPTRLTLPGRVRSVSLGEYHGCVVLESDALWCWGCNGSYMVGRGGMHAEFPEEIIAAGVATVNAGYRNSCVERGGGEIECWGEKSFGMLADGKPQALFFEAVYTPVPVTTLPLRSRVYLHQFHACALFEGTVRCWGQGVMGQVGDGALSNTTYPVIVIE